MAKNYANIQEMLPTTKGVELVLGELGQTPFEPFKEKQEEGMNINTTLEKQIIVLIEFLINVFKDHHQVSETLCQEPIVLLCVCAKFASSVITFPPCANILET